MRRPWRGSSLAAGVWAFLLLAALGTLAHARWGHASAEARLQEARAVVHALGLTDLAWFPEARYTRHPSQADLHSAFQDAPGAREHFPAGSLLQPALRYPPSGFAPQSAPRPGP
jgi:hypothetical protein